MHTKILTNRAVAVKYEFRYELLIGIFEFDLGHAFYDQAQVPAHFDCKYPQNVD